MCVCVCVCELCVLCVFVVSKDGLINSFLQAPESSMDDRTRVTIARAIFDECQKHEHVLQAFTDALKHRRPQTKALVAIVHVHTNTHTHAHKTHTHTHIHTHTHTCTHTHTYMHTNHTHILTHVLCVQTMPEDQIEHLQSVGGRLSDLATICGQKRFLVDFCSDLATSMSAQQQDSVKQAIRLCSDTRMHTLEKHFSSSHKMIRLFFVKVLYR